MLTDGHQLIAALGIGTLLTYTAILLFLLAIVGGYSYALRRKSALRELLFRRLAQGNLTSIEGEISNDDLVVRTMRTLRRSLYQIQSVAQTLGGAASEVSSRIISLDSATRQHFDALLARHKLAQELPSCISNDKTVGDELERTLEELITRLTSLTDSAKALALSDAPPVDVGTRLREQLAAARQHARDCDQLVQALSQRGTTTREMLLQIPYIETKGRELSASTASAAEAAETLRQELLRTSASLRAPRPTEVPPEHAIANAHERIHRAAATLAETAQHAKLVALNAQITASNSQHPSGALTEVLAGQMERLATRFLETETELVAHLHFVGQALDVSNLAHREARERIEVSAAFLDQGQASIDKVLRETRHATLLAKAVHLEEQSFRSELETMSTSDSEAARLAKSASSLAASQVEDLRDLEFTLDAVRRSREESNTRGSAHSEAVEAAREHGRKLSKYVAARRGSSRQIVETALEVAQGIAVHTSEAASLRQLSDELNRSSSELMKDQEALRDEVQRYRMPQRTVGGRLRYGYHRSALPQQDFAVDPIRVNDVQSAEVVSAVFSPLFRFDDGIRKPHLVSTWNVSNDYRQYVFTLRGEVLFHDGVRLTAQHVVDHYERLLRERVSRLNEALFLDIEGAREYQNGECEHVSGLKVLGPLTLELTLVRPLLDLPSMLALPCASIARVEAGNIIGTGPFRLQERSADRLLLQKHGEYFQVGHPLLNELEVRTYPSRADTLSAFRKGELDLVTNLRETNISRDGPSTIDALRASYSGLTFLGFNVRIPPFDNVRVRRAIRAGLDIQSFLARFHTNALRARSFAPPSFGAPKPAESSRPMPELARKLLSEAGHPKLSLLITHPKDRGVDEESRVLFAPLLDAGLIELSHVATSEFWERVRKGEVGIFFGNWLTDIPEIDIFYRQLFGSNGQQHYQFGYRSSELDHLIEEARATANRNQHAQLRNQIEVLLDEDCVAIPLFHEHFYALSSPALLGLRLNFSALTARFEELWLTT